MPNKLFISYPSESWNFAQRIAEGITRHLAETVFIDYTGVDDADFGRAILTNLRASDAVLLIVTQYTFEDIHKDSDWIRLEIRTALEHDIPIVLVRENGMLTPKDLPDDVKQVARSQGVPFYKEYFDPALTYLNKFLVTIGVGTLHASAPASASNTTQIISHAPTPPPTALEPQWAIQGSGSFEEATRLLEVEDYEKALFILHELKENYRGGLVGAILQLISDAEEEQAAAERRQEAALDYDDILILVQGKFSAAAAKVAFLEWEERYPDLITLLDTEQLQKRLAPPPPPDPFADALATARTYKSRHNRDWKPVLTTFRNIPIPDMKFCLVPAGSFQMGATDINDAEKPVHSQKMDQPFWVAQTPVTNAQWKIAVAAGVVDVPVTGDPRTWYQDAKMANAPVVGIDWFAATTFAEWLGTRLPTELEWEYAARGVESWVYPWGDTWVPDNAMFIDSRSSNGGNRSGNNGRRPNDVATRPQGASWVGALHLSGNVWEWTSSIYEKYPYALDNERENPDNRTNSRVLRGGSWNNSGGFLRAACRHGDAPATRNHYVGFRVGLAVV